MKLKSIILSAMLIVLLGSLAAMPSELRQVPLQQDPDLLSGKLPNGLSYYIMRNAKPANIAEMRLFVNVGSVNEDEDQRGLAHFTEHMVFNGTKNFAKTEIVNYLSSIGMGYNNGLNGMTSYDMTVYTFKIPTDNQEKLRKGMLILSDMAYQVSFETPEIERERGVIIEEWRMGQDADSRVRDAQNSVFLAGSRYAERSPIGTYDVISTFTPETIKRFYTDWYRPDMQSVVIVGDFEPADMLKLVEEYFGVIPPRENPRPRISFPVPENLEPQAVVTTDPEYPQNLLQVMWKKDVQPIQNLGGLYDDLKRNLFYTMLNTRLSEYSMSADPPFSFSMAFEYPLLRTMSTAAIFAMFTAGKGESALQTVLTEAERVQRHGFLPSEFARAKTDVLRGFERQLAQMKTRESDGIAWRVIDAIANENVNLGPQQEYELAGALMEEISLEEVNAIVSSLIQEKNMFIGLAGPQLEGMVYPTSPRLLEIAQTVGAQDIEPYVDEALNEPIMETVPEPVAIKKQSFDKRSGVRKWVLANGVQVFSKKTDFKNDEVVLSAISPGGYSRYATEDVPAAKLVTEYIADSGFGNFDSVNLSKATVGKVANASLSLDLNTEGFSASCSPQDMELMFQMLHQYGTNPRFDAEDFASFIQRTKVNYDNRKLDPMNVFIDKMYSALYSDNPYQVSLADVDLEAIDMSSLERIFRDRYADFSDFSFFIVGNFNEAALKDFCRRYLGNLPSVNRKEKRIDVGMEVVQGNKEIRFQKGVSDRSFVAHITNGGYKSSVRNGVILDALTFVLNEKLRENIREELSGVYFIQTWPNVANYPKPRLVLSTLMGCSPNRVDELNAAIFATLDSLRAGNLDERYVTAAKATLEEQYKEDIRSNYYWMRHMVGNFWNGLPLAAFMDEPKHFDKIDKKNLIKAAREYLNFDHNKLSLIMLPEALPETITPE